MIITGIKYVRSQGLPREWRIVGKDEEGNTSYATFGNLNLLVGKNASGKSRTLDVIRDIAFLISGRETVADTKFPTQCFDFSFKENGSKYRYVLSFDNRTISEETLYLNNTIVLSRKDSFIVVSGNRESVSPDPEKLLVNMKDNGGQYYFKELVLWGFSLKVFTFSDQQEKNIYVKDINKLDEDNHDIKDVGIVIPVFYWSRIQYGQKFEDEILECMNELGYKLTDIDIKKNKEGYCINVEEEGKYLVSQQYMSQGMFRALALNILLVNARWRDISFCMLIDDVGEGLDHERSKGIIDLVVRKTHNTQIQYFMTTNDRYIMNNIHVKYWSVVERQSAKAIFYNISNSRDNFENFKYTGLNNFDFYTTDFYRDGFGEEEALSED